MSKTILLVSCAIGALALGAEAAQAAAAAAAASSGGTTIGELVVTAERREENLQDTPVAVSAFSADTLRKMGVTGGQNLVLQVPNTNYSRSNFGGYNFKIRGIGVDVIAFSGTTGVSINYNEMPLSGNQFANAEFYDVDRVEVLRGPQGTLYGRNATGGAVDVITTKPVMDQFGGWGSAEYGNYATIKMQGAVNLPLGSAFALRIAGSKLLQNGFGTNIYNGQSVDGRDLGSIRVSLAFKPSDKFDSYLIYENYSEDDTRNRVGKQLCIKDPGPSSVGGGPALSYTYSQQMTQGCLQGSLFQPLAYGALNSNGTLGGQLANAFGLNNGVDLFANYGLQNTNLHDIQSVIQPLWKTNQQIVDWHMAWHINDELTLSNILGFNQGNLNSAEDYNRIVPKTPYTPSTGLGNILWPNGVVHDPQTGTSNLITAFDYGTAQGKEYTDELRLSSSFKGKFNFLAGLYYDENTSHPGANNYFVEGNSLTAATQANNTIYSLYYQPTLAFYNAHPGYIPPGQTAQSLAAAAGSAHAPFGNVLYIDPNYPPDGSGHNYYDARSGGGYLKTYAGFGEVYYNLLDDLKLTLGGRYNVDQLYTTVYPISLVSGTPNNAAQNYLQPVPGSPYLSLPDAIYPAVGGFPASVCTHPTTTAQKDCLNPQSVTYRAFTGRVNLDWTPHVSFTDKTLVYATYSRGYKGGGFNTPCQIGLGTDTSNVCPYPVVYNPEYVNAFELGTKNTLAGGKVTANLDGFYYDYTGYQVSTIIAKSSVNSNINSKIWGLEFEGQWSPIPSVVFNTQVGWLGSSIDGGQFSLDTMNMTHSDPNYHVVKVNDGSNCIARVSDINAFIAANPSSNQSKLYLACAGTYANFTIDPATGKPMGALTSANLNAGGIPYNLSGNSMPNSPQFTVSVGAQYTAHITGDWQAVLRGDFYFQDSSYARIYNAVNDVLQSYEVFNATLTVMNNPEGIQAMFFVKNAFNAQPITATYVTDASSGLFQNSFTLDPRTYGVQLMKRF